MKEELEEKLNKMYVEFENDLPPAGFVTAHEKSYNTGFYEGKLKAIEHIVRELTGKTGSELIKN